MEKINIAKLLEDCPKGMELDCTMFDDVTLLEVTDSRFPIKIAIGDYRYRYLTETGGYANDIIPESKCVIFPKGKTTWEGFVPPCKFKDGDVVAIDTAVGAQVFIFKEFINTKTDYACCHVMLDDDGAIDFECGNYYVGRFATEEEKGRLFKAIKENGYKWNGATKTLEKLIKSKFKIGDKIRQKNQHEVFLVSMVHNNHYLLDEKDIPLPFFAEDDYELVPNKFDITTLVPVESRVLVRDYDNRMWMPTFWGKRLEGNFNCSYLTTSGCYKYCIPYEGNQHLLGTTDDCDEFYKTWK